MPFNHWKLQQQSEIHTEAWKNLENMGNAQDSERDFLLFQKQNIKSNHLEAMS